MFIVAWQESSRLTCIGPNSQSSVHNCDCLLSGCITSSTRLYYETLGPLATGEAIRSSFFKPVPVPCGIAIFAKEPFAAKVQGWVEANGYNVRRWSEFPRGGHFAAREEPAILCGDIRAFVFGDLALEEIPKAGLGASASSKL